MIPSIFTMIFTMLLLYLLGGVGVCILLWFVYPEVSSESYSRRNQTSEKEESPQGSDPNPYIRTCVATHLPDVLTQLVCAYTRYIPDQLVRVISLEYQPSAVACTTRHVVVSCAIQDFVMFLCPITFQIQKFCDIVAMDLCSTQNDNLCILTRQQLMWFVGTSVANIRLLDKHTEPVVSVASHENLVFVATRNLHIDIFDDVTKQHISSLRSDLKDLCVWGIAITSTTFIMTGVKGSRIGIWNMHMDQHAGKINVHHEQTLQDVSLLSDLNSRGVVIVDEQLAFIATSHGQSSFIRVLSMNPGPSQCQELEIMDTGNRAIDGLTLSKGSGQILACCRDTRELLIYE